MPAAALIGGPSGAHDVRHDRAEHTARSDNASLGGGTSAWRCWQSCSGLARYLEFVPHAALAGMLAVLGWQIIDWRFLARVGRVQREHLLIMLTTLSITVLVDLVTAVAVGLIVAGMVGARQLERLQLDSVVSVPLLDQIFLHDHTPDTHGINPYSARVGMVKLRGSFTVASSSKLIRTIGDDIVGHEVVILDFLRNRLHRRQRRPSSSKQLIDMAAAGEVACIVMALEGNPAGTLESLNVLRPNPRRAHRGDARREPEQSLGRCSVTARSM